MNSTAKCAGYLTSTHVDLYHILEFSPGVGSYTETSRYQPWRAEDTNPPPQVESNMNLLIRVSCGTQLWLIRHPNFLTRAILSLFYAVDVIVYSVRGARTFLTRRASVCGRTFASLGKLVVGDYDKVAEIIAHPQRRGAFLGRGRLIPQRLPKDFLLFLSDEGAGGNGAHKALHDYIWNTLIMQAQERLSEPDLQTYIDDFVEAVKPLGYPPPAKKMAPEVQRMVIRYMMRSLFGLQANDSQIATMRTLFFTGTPFSSYVLSALKPLAPPSFLLGGLHRSVAEMTKLIENSPALQDYTPSAENANLTKEQYSRLLLAIVGIAAFDGTSNLATYVLTELPTDYPLDLDDTEAIKLAVLETARRHTPVNNINVLLQEATEIEVGGRSYTFPAGTVVDASICLGCLDPNQFPDPSAFKPDRDNLVSAMLSFNSVGFHPDNVGTRSCPGRNVAVRMSSDLLVAWRKANT